MKRMMGGAALLATMMVVTPLHADAQQGGRGRRAQTMDRPGGGVEMLMRQRDRLQLTEDQIEKLDQIRAEMTKQRSAHQAEMAEFRSKVAAGQMDREELRAIMEARRESSEAMRAQHKQRVDAVLTEAQRDSVAQWQARAQAFMRGRRSGLRDGARLDRGMRGEMRRGMQRGMRGEMRPGRGHGRGDGMGHGMRGGMDADTLDGVEPGEAGGGPPA